MFNFKIRAIRFAFNHSYCVCDMIDGSTVRFDADRKRKCWAISEIIVAGLAV
jgi:hypothetical protein